MIEHPNDLEDTLDIIWGIIKDENERWDKILGGTLGTTRMQLVERTGWPYSTVHRLVEILEKQGQVTVKYTHQHQSYWEGHYRCA